MRIRPYETRDAEGVVQVYRNAVMGIGPVHYSAEQVAAWASLTPSAAAVHARASDGRRTLVAVNEADQPVGFIDLEADGHIDLFYCALELAGTGLGARLYDAVESMARAGGMKRLYSEASEAALRFFRKRGFVTLHRRDLMIGDVAIHNYAVEKRLN
jgi:putative acetyltransferase